MTPGWGFLAEMQKAGREIDPEDLPPGLEWEDEIWQLYERVATQWRPGFNGPSGLDYGPAIKLIEYHGYDLLLALTLLQVIERATLQARAESTPTE